MKKLQNSQVEEQQGDEWEACQKLSTMRDKERKYIMCAQFKTINIPGCSE